MAKGKNRYPKGGKRCRCRVPGCTVRRDTPQAIRAHRVKDHGESWKTGPRKKKEETTAGLPSRPKMRKVESKGIPFRRRMLRIVPDSDLVEEVERRWGSRR